MLGALVNSVFLVALCFSILIESIQRCVSILLKCSCPAIIFIFSDRFFAVEDIQNPQLILIVGAIGLGINLIGLLLFKGKSIAIQRARNDEK